MMLTPDDIRLMAEGAAEADARMLKAARDELAAALAPITTRLDDLAKSAGHDADARGEIAAMRLELADIAKADDVAAVSARLGEIERATADAIRAALDPLLAQLRAIEAQTEDAPALRAKVEAIAKTLEGSATKADLEAARKAIDGWAMLMPDEIETRLVPVLERLAAVEKVQPLKGDPGQDRPLIEITTWGPDTTSLPKGAIVTDDGSTFLALREALGSPRDEPTSWHCLAAGFGEIAAEQISDRTIRLEFNHGHERAYMNFELGPIPLPRGLYDPTKAYEAGDTVSEDGAQWLASRDVAPHDVRPGKDASPWRLFAARGKTGRPGKDAKGDKGDPGLGIKHVIANGGSGPIVELSDGTILRPDGEAR